MWEKRNHNQGFAVLVPSLWFSGRIMRGGPSAGIYVVGLATFFLILGLGLGLSPIPLMDQVYVCLTRNQARG